MLDRRIVLLLAATTLLAVVALRAATDGGVLGLMAAGLLGIPAALGLLVLTRIAYVDGVEARGRTARTRALRRRL